MTAGEKQGRAYGGVPAEERKRERRARLVEAGLELYGTTGFVATTLEQVCARAGLNKRYFYESFASADELLAAVYADATTRAQERVVQAIAEVGEDLGERAAAGIAAFFVVADEDRRIARVLLSELLPVSDVARDAIRAGTHAWMELIGAVFDGYAYRGHAVQLVTASIWALMAGSAIRWALDDFAEPVEEITALLADVVRDVLVNVTRG